MKRHRNKSSEAHGSQLNRKSAEVHEPAIVIGLASLCLVLYGGVGTITKSQVAHHRFGDERAAELAASQGYEDVEVTGRSTVIFGPMQGCGLGTVVRYHMEAVDEDESRVALSVCKGLFRDGIVRPGVSLVPPDHHLD